jgi:predicted aspartyl protease
MRIDPQASIIVVQVELHGDTSTRVVDMALDTGATFVTIPRVVADGLGYDPSTAERRLNLATASSLEIVPLITLKGVRTLEVEATDVEAACR